MATVVPAVTLQALAKVNLTLEVMGKRSDGYHELRSVVQCISLADTLRLQPGQDGIILRAYGYQVPTGPDNLCYQAADAFIKSVGQPAGVHIDLVKRIPVGRGLGGGSSDAAAVLCGLNMLSRRALSEEDVEKLSVELGSDVPLFLTGGTLLIEGRGNIVQQVPGPQPPLIFVVAWPGEAVPTGEAYRLLATEDFADGARTEAVVKKLRSHEALREADLYNCFEPKVLGHWPAVAEVHAQLAEVLGGSVLLAGSGSAVFGLAQDRETGYAAAAQMRTAGYEAVVAEPVSNGSVIIQRDSVVADE